MKLEPRLAAAACFLLAAVQMTGQEALPPAWKHWRLSLPVAADSLPEGLARVTLPVEVYGETRDGLEDLRLIDDTGREVPYVLSIRRGGRTTDWRRVVVLDTGTVPDRYSQVVLDTGTAGEPHNLIEIETPATEFFARVEIAASDDRRTWRVVKDAVPIYRFDRSGLAGTRQLHYPDTTSRWLRLRLYGLETSLEITGARIAQEITEQPEWQPLGGTVSPMEKPPGGHSGWEIDLGTARVPVAGVSFRADPAAFFHRPVKVRSSEDREQWRDRGQGHIYNYASEVSGDGSRSLRVEFPEGRGRYWRILVVNRNDAPVDRLSLELVGVPRHVVFRPEADRRYRVLVGNAEANAPSYDLARLTSKEDREAAHPVAVGQMEENAAWEDPAPWSERNPWVLWMAMLAAVAVVAWLAVSALKNPA